MILDVSHFSVQSACLNMHCHALLSRRLLPVVATVLFAVTALTLPAFGQPANVAATKSAPTTLKVGFGTADITPSPGSEMPYGYQRRVGTGAHDRLLVNACVVFDGITPVALVAPKTD